MKQLSPAQINVISFLFIMLKSLIEEHYSQHMQSLKKFIDNKNSYLEMQPNKVSLNQPRMLIFKDGQASQTTQFGALPASQLPRQDYPLVRGGCFVGMIQLISDSSPQWLTLFLTPSQSSQLNFALSRSFKLIPSSCSSLALSSSSPPLLQLPPSLALSQQPLSLWNTQHLETSPH